MPYISNFINMIDIQLDNMDQGISSMTEVKHFEKLLSDTQLTLLFRSYFFPKWISYLNGCLTLSSNPNYAGIANCYQGWKEALSANFGYLECIKSGLNEALEMINSIIDSESTSTVSVTKSKLAKSILVPQKAPSSMRDIVDMKCTEKGLTFLPVTNRLVVGKQVYKAGHLSIYFDKSARGRKTSLQG